MSLADRHVLSSRRLCVSSSLSSVHQPIHTSLHHPIKVASLAAASSFAFCRAKGKSAKHSPQGPEIRLRLRPHVCRDLSGHFRICRQVAAGNGKLSPG
jgi:hypothetical protein